MQVESKQCLTPLFGKIPLKQKKLPLLPSLKS